MVSEKRPRLIVVGSRLQPYREYALASLDVADVDKDPLTQFQRWFAEAVRAGHPLSFERMKWIAEQLWTCEVPTTCPHGRLAVVRLSGADLDARFGRTWSSREPTASAAGESSRATDGA